MRSSVPSNAVRQGNPPSEPRESAPTRPRCRRRRECAWRWFPFEFIRRYRRYSKTPHQDHDDAHRRLKRSGQSPINTRVFSPHWRHGQPGGRRHHDQSACPHRHRSCARECRDTSHNSPRIPIARSEVFGASGMSGRFKASALPFVIGAPDHEVAAGAECRPVTFPNECRLLGGDSRHEGQRTTISP